MQVLLVGLNHHTAPVSVRERFAFSKHRLPEALDSFIDGEHLTEGMILSTCNRVELLSVTPHEPHEGIHYVESFLTNFHRKIDGIHEHLYQRAEVDAIRHVFRVTASLDSMIVGEPQIMGQVKEAYAVAQDAGKMGPVLSKLMHKAFNVAKRVRTETKVGSNAISVSYAAVELARRIFNSLEGHTVMLVGAGEMAELAATHLLNAGASRIIVSSRSLDKATQLAEKFQGEALAFDDYRSRLAESDILIFATAAPHFVIEPEDVKAAMARRHNKPMFIIDISVPRNVDPRINLIEHVFVYDVDDLQAVINANLREREAEARKAELIVEDEITRFASEIRMMAAGPFIAALNDHLTEMAEAEFERHRRKLERLGGLTPEVEEYIRHTLITSIMKKFAHPLIEDIRESAASGTNSLLCNRFRLNARVMHAQRKAV
jgi:glutamyl-tRNA reductase